MSLTESWGDLSDELAGVEPEWETDPQEVNVEGLEQAERYGHRLRRLREEQTVDDEVARAQIDQVQAWLGRRTLARVAKTSWIESVLAHFHAATLASDPKRKTIGLPSVTLKARGQQPEWVFTDEQAFIDWARDHVPLALRVKTEIDKNATKVALTVKDESGVVLAVGVDENGEVPPGLEVHERGVKFTAVTTGDEE